MGATPVALQSRIFDELSAADQRVWLAAARLRSLRRREALVRQGAPAADLIAGCLRQAIASDGANASAALSAGPHEYHARDR